MDHYNRADFSGPSAFEPLAGRVRPLSLDDFFGQEGVIGQGRPLFKINKRGWHMIGYIPGPPESGRRP